MKKKIIITATFAACLALCAAVWPQAETVKETPIPNETTVVTAPEATVEELKAEAETTSPTEKEKTEILRPEPAPTEIPAVPEVRPAPESELVAEATHGPVQEQTTEQPTTQETIESQSGDMVYVEGFGWIESQGPNHVEYAEDMYENGNKIGIMG